MVATVGYDIYRTRELRNNETIHSVDGQDKKEYDEDELLMGGTWRGDGKATPFFHCSSDSSVHGGAFF